jgi:hypothetical protein
VLDLGVKRNEKPGFGNWSVGNVLLLSTRKASVAGERWSTGVSAQPTVHRLALWAAQLSTAGACTRDASMRYILFQQQIHLMIG